MVTAKVIYDEQGIKPLFHLYLVSGKKNKLFSTLPPPLLWKCFMRELMHIQHALVVNHASAHRLMEDFAYKVLNCRVMQPYFYSDYLHKTNLNNDFAETIIKYQEGFVFKPGMCFSKNQSPVDFYYVSQRFIMNKKHILNTGKSITYEVFKSKYLNNSTTQKYYKTEAREGDTFLELDDESFDYAIVVSQENELKMLISV
jgi:mannose-1-phosphate guanylyltransferase